MHQILEITARADRVHFAPTEQPDALDAFGFLRDEMADALMGNPHTRVAAPGFTSPNTAADIVADDMAGKHGDELLHDLLRVLRMAATGEHGAQIELYAQAVIARQAREYAEYHAADQQEAMQ